MKKISSSIMRMSVIGVTLVLLAGCGDFGKKKKEAVEVAKDDVVLLKIGNQPSVTKTQFYQILGAMVGKMDPTMLPKETQKKVLQNLARFKLAAKAAEKAGITKDEEFSKAYREQKRHMKEELLVGFFEKKKFNEVAVSIDEKRAHFDKNKNLYVKEQGGSQVSGVSFADRDKAQTFYDNVKANLGEFESIGRKEKDGRFRDFGQVSDAPETGYSMVPKAVKEAALKLSRLPGIDLIKDGKETWVISVSEKKEPVSFTFEEVEDRITQQLKVNKFREIRKTMYEGFKKEYPIEINEEFFKVAEPQAPEPQAPAAPQGPAGPQGPQAE